MNLGGTEKAFLGAVDQLLQHNVEVTLLLLEKRGDLLIEVPPSVKIITLAEYEANKYILNEPIRYIIGKIYKNEGPLFTLKTLGYYLFYKITGNKSSFFDLIIRRITSVTSEYDVAIAYAGPMDFVSYYLLKYIKADQKFQWLHFDLTKIYMDKIFINLYYPKFDSILCVSVLIEQQIKAMVSTDLITHCIPNVISSNKVTELAKLSENFDSEFKGIKLVTVARAAHEKGIDLAIDTLKLLIEQGHDVKWYWVGGGNSSHKYKKMINQFKLQNKFVLLGNQLNPYKFMKHADIYVQPSRHEGYCISIDEALILKKPSIVTNFLGIENRISNGNTGFIVAPNVKSITEGIARLIKNPELRAKIAHALLFINLYKNNKTLPSLLNLQG
jgi:glycosyltransferase involved in cell wall biosynthesis